MAALIQPEPSSSAFMTPNQNIIPPYSYSSSAISQEGIMDIFSKQTLTGYTPQGQTSAVNQHQLAAVTPRNYTESPTSLPQSFHQLPTQTPPPVFTFPSICQQPAIPSRLPWPSSISRMPNELLGEIFRYYASDWYLTEDASAGVTRSFSHTNALLLGQVNRHWRDVAISLRELWTSISVSQPEARHVPLFQLWLERSGSRPLQLRITQSHSFQPDDIPMRNILSLAAQQAHRWKDISLTLFYNIQDAFFGTKIAGNVNNLESINLDLEDWDSDTVAFLCGALHSSPKLTKAAWGRSCNDDIPYAAPWGQLQHIELDHVSTSIELFDILSRCGQLEYLAVDMMPFTVTNTQHPHITLPLLRDARWGSIDNLPFILNHLTLPSLHELAIYGGFFSDPKDGLNAVQNLLSRSDCRLETLSLTAAQLDEMQLVALLQSRELFHLRQLHLSASVTNTTICALTDPHSTIALDAKPACPALCNLKVLQLPVCRASSEAIHTFIRSRLIPSPKRVALERFEVGLSIQMDCAETGYIKDLGNLDHCFPAYVLDYNRI